MRFAFVLFAVLSASLALAGTPSATISPSASYYQIDVTKPPSPPTPVYVVNFPDVQAVAGAVSVDNLPAVQTVGGTVNVGNLPLDPDGAVRVTSAPARQPALIELLTTPLVVPTGIALSAPFTVNTVGYSSFGVLVTVPSGGSYARPIIEWRWGSDESFVGAIDDRNGNYGAPGISGSCDAPANIRMLCNVAGAELRVSVLNTYSNDLPVQSIRIYLIP